MASKNSSKILTNGGDIMIQYMIDAPIHFIFGGIEDVEALERELQELKKLKFPVKFTFKNRLDGVESDVEPTKEAG